MTPRLNVGIIFPNFLRKYGGSRYTQETADALSEYCDVTVYTLDTRPEGLFTKAKVVSLGKSFRNHKVHTLAEWFLMPVLARKIKRHDVLLAVGACSTLAAGNAGRRLKTPFVYLCTEPPRFLYDLKDLPNSRFPGRRVFEGRLRALDQWMVRRAMAIVSISEWIAQQVRDIYGRESEIVYPGLDVTPFLAITREEAREALGIATNVNLFLSLAKLHPRKQIDTLIPIFQEQAGNDPNALFVIAGDGPDRQRLENLVKATGDQRIRFVGYVSDEDRIRWHRAANTFLFNARDEPFGLAPLEAKVSGANVLPLCPLFPIVSVREATLKLYLILQAAR